MGKQAPGRESLIYRPSVVSWATAHFIARPPALAARIFLYGVELFIVVALAYSWFAQVAISVGTRGVLVTREPVLAIRAPFGMTVAKLNAKSEVRVKRGEVLVEAEDRVSNEEFDLIDSQKKGIEELLAKEKVGQCSDCLAAFKKLGDRAFKLENKGAVRTVLAETRQQLLDYVSYQDKWEGLDAATMSIRRRIIIADGKLKEIRRRQAEDLLAMQVESLTSEIVQARSELVQTRQNLEAQLTQSRNGLEVRLGGLMNTVEQYRSQGVIVAPIDGVVSGLKVSGPGQFLAAGEPLLEIIPLDSGLRAELFVSNKDISGVNQGMKVRLKLDALPEREFGALDGVVENVPANVVSPSDPAGAPHYRVAVKLEQQSLSRGGVEHPFRLGMTLSGLVVIRHESLFILGLRKVFTLKDEIASE